MMVARCSLTRHHAQTEQSEGERRFKGFSRLSISETGDLLRWSPFGVYREWSKGQNTE